MHVPYIISEDCNDLVIHFTAELSLHSEQTATTSVLKKRNRLSVYGIWQVDDYIHFPASNMDRTISINCTRCIWEGDISALL